MPARSAGPDSRPSHIKGIRIRRFLSRGSAAPACGVRIPESSRGSPLFKMLQARVKNFFHSAEFRLPGHTHIVEAYIDMRAQVVDAGIQVAQPRVVDQDAD